MAERFRWKDLDASYGNAVLYRMCAEEPAHTCPDVVVGKIWLIGRAYAAPIERKSGEVGKTDEIYKRVATAMCGEFDDWLAMLSNLKNIDSSNLNRILTVHNRFIGLLKKNTGLGRRSFASKYLHFHMPQAFFIYDSRADAEIRRRVGRIAVPADCKEANPVYGAFAARCIRYRDSNPAKRDQTPRELDRELLGY